MPEGDNTDRIERRKAIRKKIGCVDLTTLHELVREEAKPIVVEAKRISEEVSADAERPTLDEKQALLATALAMNEKFKKERSEQGASADKAQSCTTSDTPTEEDIAEFNTKMMDDAGVIELSTILIERILEEQKRRKALVAERDAGAAVGGSRKRKRSKKRKGKGNKTRKNAQNNNNNNTTRRRKKTARRRRTKRE